MMCTVVFLALASLLVFQDQVLFVVVDMAAANNANLRMTVHDLTVSKHAVDRVMLENTVFDQLLKVGRGLVIDGRIVRVVFRRKINIRPYDMQKAERISVRQCRGFVAVDNVVRNRSHFGRQFCHWSQSLKRLNSRHESNFHRVQNNTVLRRHPRRQTKAGKFNAVSAAS